MKTSFLCALLSAGLFLLLAPQPAQGQVAYGISAVGYNSNTREVFGYSATWVDYNAGYYYDPGVEGELYSQYNNEVPLDSGYNEGFSSLVPAEVWTYSTFYRPNTRYDVYSNHFVRAYYYYSHCSGSFYGCYADPYRFSYFTGGGYGGNYGWPGFVFNPELYLATRRYYLGTTHASIITSDTNPCGTSADLPCPPPPPTPTPTPTPNPSPTTNVYLYVDPPELRPFGTTGGANTARVTVRIVPARAGRSVSLSLKVPDSLSGHEDGGHVAGHIGTRPLGRLRATHGTTDNAGQFQTTYTPSHISGKVEIDAGVDGIGVGHFAYVRVPDLQELGTGDNYALIGSNAAHPFNHWGTAAANLGLRQIADDYKNRFYGQNPIPEGDKLRYNDQSLPWGGKFDLGMHWSNTGDHDEHREGINCDVRCCGIPGLVPRNRWVALNEIFFNRGSTRTNDETSTRRPHWHLRFEFGHQQSVATMNVGNFLDAVWWAALNREASNGEWQSRMDMLEQSQALSSSQLLDASKGVVRGMFQMTEYANRHRSDEDYVTDLYWTYLQRAPDEEGRDYWLGILRDDDAHGLEGREHLLQAFEGSEEFANLVGSLVGTPAPPACDPAQEQSCYDQGGTWDMDTCSCSFEPDPCEHKPWLCQ